MTKTFIKSGSSVRIRDKSDMQPYDQLPPATYVIKYDERAGEFYLEQIGSFTLPDKIYGKNNNYADRILQTFADRSGSTGVLLSGIKGAGKTLLAKQTSVMGAKIGIPTIVINKDWCGDEFNSFIQSITTPAIVLFDEFEKIYGYAEQRKILTLFDGVFPSRKLFLITTNQEREISEYMNNRPGRIFYNFAFDTLGQDFIEEFLNDRLIDKSQIVNFLKYTSVFSFFNFDMLNAAVEEMNRYNETLADVLEFLNIKPENRHTDTYTLQVVLNDKVYVIDSAHNNFQPNTFNYTLWADNDMPKVLSGDAVAKKKIIALSQNNAFGEGSIDFNQKHIKRFDQVENRFVYSVGTGNDEIELHVTRNDQFPKWKFDGNAF
jgi:hypothetical protein